MCRPGCLWPMYTTQGTMKLLMWKESAAIVAVRHLSTEVSNREIALLC